MRMVVNSMGMRTDWEDDCEDYYDIDEYESDDALVVMTDEEDGDEGNPRGSETQEGSSEDDSDISRTPMQVPSIWQTIGAKRLQTMHQ